MAAEPIACGGCDARWTARGACHCAAPGCHRTFSGLTLFDGHRSMRGEHGTCADPAGLEGYVQRPDGVWRGPDMDPERRAELAAKNPAEAL